FFQAEDGIRDGHVTGVQTCALPIFAHLDGDEMAHEARQVLEVAPERVERLRRLIDGHRFLDAHAVAIGDADVVLPLLSRAAVLRSEERRVGKEGRSWLWRAVCKDKG